MTQLLKAGATAVKAIYAGASLVRRVRDGNSGKLLYEHPDYPTLDFLGGVLPSPASVPSAGKYQVTYARAGTAWRWLAASPQPLLASVTADTPRFSVCPPGARSNQTGQPMGLLFEPAVQNILPYGRADATVWTSSNVSVGATTGIDGTSNAARTLTATVADGLHYLSTPPASQAAQWCFSAWVKRLAGLGQVFLTLQSGIEYDISAALANFTIDASDNHQFAWARVYLAMPGQGPWYGDINTCDRIGFRIAESGDAIAVDAMQLEAAPYPTSEILNPGATLNTRSADRLLVDINVGGTATRYLLDADDWAADSSATALLWRIRQERHLARILIEPNGGNWDMDLQTPPENRVNMGYHDGCPSLVIYDVTEPEGIAQRTQIYPSGYVISAATFDDSRFATLPQYARFDGSTNNVLLSGTAITGAASANILLCGYFKLPAGYSGATSKYLFAGPSLATPYAVVSSLGRLQFLFRGNGGGLGSGGNPYANLHYPTYAGQTIAFMLDIAITGSGPSSYVVTPRGVMKKGKAAGLTTFDYLTPSTGISSSAVTTDNSIAIAAKTTGSNRLDADIGAIWFTHGVAIDASSATVWQDFFGAGSHNAGTPIDPQFLTANGAFGSYAAPAFFVDWCAHDGKANIDSKGSVTGTGAATGTIVFGNWDFSI